jgi:hypothetical protein
MVKEIDEEYKLLIEQRRMLVQDIEMFNKAFHTALFSTLTVIVAAVAIFYSDIVEASPQVRRIFLFVLIQIVFGILWLIMQILSASNTDREYIRAIDDYIRETYKIKALFYQGDLTFHHVNKIGSSFSIKNFVPVLIIVLICAGIICHNHSEVLAMAKASPFFATIVLLEIAGTTVFAMRRLRYKKNGKSEYYEDCYIFLKHGYIRKPTKRMRFKGRR